MDYAIVEISGKQYTLEPGKTVAVDKLDHAAGDTVTFQNVLVYASNGETSIGAPYVDGVTVSAKVVEQKKSKKIHVLRFKAKSHYHKATGHRAQRTVLQVAEFGKAKAAAKA